MGQGAVRSVCVVVLLCCPGALRAYSVLTHQQIIDLTWEPNIVPILRERFPGITADQLKRAHAYAYGGCAIQDLGYYPFGKQFFSDLTHYVRSGDFVRSLFRHANTPDELAFAIGALSHYIGDSIGHSLAVNRSVPIYFPKLRAKYGTSVNYAEDKHAHVRTELAFDVNQVTKKHMAPSAYLRSVGLRVPRTQLAAAFDETYGLKTAHVIGLFRTALRTYRFGTRTFLPAIAHAEGLLHRGNFPPETSGPEGEAYRARVAAVMRATGWDRYRRTRPSIGTYLLAGLIAILPKLGRLTMLSIKGPNAETELLYIRSVNRCIAALARRTRQLTAPRGEADEHDSSAVVPDRDLDTGERVKPGGYPLTDRTYAKLLAEVTKVPSRPIPAGLKRDILAYYADPSAPISTKQDEKKWAAVQHELTVLAHLPEIPDPE
jgi:hypothetical protein